MTQAWLLLAGAIVAEVVGTSALKASDGFTRLVAGGYGIAFYLLALTLRHMPVGVAYAVWSGAGTALIALVGWALFDQRLGPTALAGMALISAGVVLMNLSSTSSGH